MRVTEFLKKCLKDNGSVAAGLAPHRDANCIVPPLENGNGTDNLRRATNFLRDVEEKVKNSLSDDSLIVSFGDEFEFSRDQTFINLHGDSLENRLTIETGNIIGQVCGRCEGCAYELRVGSRFGDQFLMHMIASAEGFLELEDMGTVAELHNTDWLLVYLWKVRLKQAFTAGVPKLYVRKTERLPMIRGDLDLNACLRVPADLGRYVCNYREHSFDNEITRLINKTFKYLERGGNGWERLLADVQRLRGAFLEACNDRPLLPARGTRPISNPYFAAYEEVAKLSRMILAGESGGLGTDDDEFSGFLFDVSLLFEHYIRKLLGGSGLTLEPKATNPVTHPSGGGCRRLLPDIMLHGSRGTLILDVKYKRWESWTNSKYPGNSRTDLFQIMTYAAAYRQRYQNRCPVFGYGFVFPIQGNEKDPPPQRFKAFGMHFYIFFLRIPEDEHSDSKNPDRLETSMKENERDFVKNVELALQRRLPEMETIAND
ncbi:MAG: 5-methylcytosine restriction system specificity protein McrC [Candidatus Binataceae bacterium]